MMEEILASLDEKKARLDAARPLPSGVVAKLKEYFDVEWTYHSNAIEGSTLTLAETRLVLLDGLTVGAKSLREHLEAINHQHAIDFVEALARKEEPITEHNIRQTHALILRTIDDENAGRYRSVSEFVREAIADKLQALAQSRVAEQLERYCANGLDRRPSRRAPDRRAPAAAPGSRAPTPVATNPRC